MLRGRCLRPSPCNPPAPAYSHKVRAHRGHLRLIERSIVAWKYQRGLRLRPRDPIRHAREDHSQKLLLSHAFGLEYGHGRWSALRVTSRDTAFGYAGGDFGFNRRFADYSDG